MRIAEQTGTPFSNFNLPARLFAPPPGDFRCRTEANEKTWLLKRKINLIRFEGANKDFLERIHQVREVCTNWVNECLVDSTQNLTTTRNSKIGRKV